MDHSENMASKRWRPKLRFSLRLLLLVVTLLSLWLASQANRAKRQKLAVRAVQELGGEVRYDYQTSYFEELKQLVRNRSNRYPSPSQPRPRPIVEPSGPKWLRQLIGDEYFQKVVGVHFRYGRDISGPTMEHIYALTELEELLLMLTDITDSDLRGIGNLSNLRLLVIHNTQVTNAGILRLRSLRRLEYLDVNNTLVTADGVAKLKEHLPECLVHLESPPLPNREKASEYLLPGESSILIPRPPEL